MTPSRWWPRMLACAVLVTGCGGEAAVAPTDPLASGRLEVTPSQVRLLSTAPDNSVQVSVVSRNDAGQLVPYDGPVYYWTKDTHVARVDQDGTVTAIEPGEATILAYVGSGSRSRTVSTNVTVWSGHESYDFAGTYDLTMVNLTPEPPECWCGAQLGRRWDATIVFEGRDPVGLVGTVPMMREFQPDGTLEPVSWTGEVKSQPRAYGQEVLQLKGFTLIVHSYTPDLIMGRFESIVWPGSSFAWTGPFELRRR